MIPNVSWFLFLSFIHSLALMLAYTLHLDFPQNEIHLSSYSIESFASPLQPSHRLDHPIMSDKDCKQYLTVLWRPPCGCKICPTCYMTEYRELWSHWPRTFQKSVPLGPILDPTWRCPHCNAAIGDSSGAPYAHAAYIFQHGTPSEKKKRAKKDKTNP